MLLLFLSRSALRSNGAGSLALLGSLASLVGPVLGDFGPEGVRCLIESHLDGMPPLLLKVRVVVAWVAVAESRNAFETLSEALTVELEALRVATVAGLATCCNVSWDHERGGLLLWMRLRLRLWLECLQRMLSSMRVFLDRLVNLLQGLLVRPLGSILLLLSILVVGRRVFKLFFFIIYDSG
jgi:hypothetical protein